MMIKKMLGLFGVIIKTIKYAIEFERELAKYKKCGYDMSRRKMKWLFKKRVGADGWSNEFRQGFAGEPYAE